MTEQPPLSRDDVRVIARAANLDLPDDRLEALENLLTQYRRGMQNVYRMEIGDLDPPALEFRDWVDRESNE